jgi:hypothetical protein
MDRFLTRLRGRDHDTGSNSNLNSVQVVVQPQTLINVSIDVHCDIDGNTGNSLSDHLPTKKFKPSNNFVRKRKVNYLSTVDEITVMPSTIDSEYKPGNENNDNFGLPEDATDCLTG